MTFYFCMYKVGPLPSTSRQLICCLIVLCVIDISLHHCHLITEGTEANDYATFLPTTPLFSRRPSNNINLALEIQTCLPHVETNDRFYNQSPVNRWSSHTLNKLCGKPRNMPLLDPEIDRVDRSSRSFDDGVELSQLINEKSSRSIESIVRLWSRVSRLYTKSIICQLSIFMN